MSESPSADSSSKQSEHQEPPWYAKFLVLANFCLLGGAVLVLCGTGGVEISGLGFKYTPKNDQTSFVLVSLGIVFMLVGLTLHLRSTRIWHPALPIVCLALAIVEVALAGAATFSKVSAKDDSIGLFDYWRATSVDFLAAVKTEQLKKYERDGYQIMLICRKDDRSVASEYDQNTQKSEVFPISTGPAQNILVKFTPEFSKALGPGDLVQCSVALLPKDLENYAIKGIKTINDVKKAKGIVFSDVAEESICPVQPSRGSSGSDGGVNSGASAPG
ncbi:hypothetical protein [Burkholderia stagnalis]|uniref:hypothetical protein n=1 Tax=Burkholderia stagnalis TaxID=1503054 RepID=UPI000F7FC883|nr:hypothetical protein [Burkholderia stagnalis]